MMAHQISPRTGGGGSRLCHHLHPRRRLSSARPFAPRLNLFCHVAGSGSLGNGPGSSSTRTRLFPYAAGLKKTIFDDLELGGEYRHRRLFPEARRLLSSDGPLRYGRACGLEVGRGLSIAASAPPIVP